jgi:hypothetical protein
MEKSMPAATKPRPSSGTFSFAGATENTAKVAVWNDLNVLRKVAASIRSESSSKKGKAIRRKIVSKKDEKNR